MIAAERPIVLSSGITLEGPFLELLWAAYQVYQQANVMPRYETLGTHHDVLVKMTEHCIMYETTGQAQMSAQKINRLSNDALQLADRLQKNGEPPLKEVILVSATLHTAWQEEASKAFGTCRRHMERAAQISLGLIEDYKLLRLLLESGLLGIRLIENRVVFAGPEDYAIRYDMSKRQFVSGFASLDQTRFHQLPHSFLPSYYWDQRYHSLFEDFKKRMKDELEGEPAWAYQYQYGLKWGSAEEIRELYERWHKSWSRTYSMLSQGSAFVENRRSVRRNEYYAVHVFDINEIVTRDRVSDLKGMARQLFWELKEAREYLTGEKAGIYLYSASDTWSPLAWSEAKETVDKEFYSGNTERGSDILLALLNAGYLGFHYLRNNLITLASPPLPAIRLTVEGLREPAPKK